MKKMFIEKTFIGTLILTVLLSLSVVYAVDQEELDEAKALIDQQVSCAKLADEQLELIGEYYMEQMHPGEAHKIMHKMMGLEEGSETEEQFHVNMARTMYCDESDGKDGMMKFNGRIQSGGMMVPMGMMRNMMGGGMMGGDLGNLGNYGSYGYTPWWTIAWYLFWIAVIVLLIWSIYHFIIKREGRDNALQIFKKRFAEGEIAQKEFEEMKKKIRE